MRRSYVIPLFALAAAWGASYLFIKVGVRDFKPTTLITLRLLIAAVPLFGFLWVRSSLREAAHDVRATWRDGLVLGAINTAIPYTLIAWGETHIDSGIAAIANSMVPIFVALLAIRFRPSERVTGWRLGGIAIGFLGVGILAGVNPQGGWWAVAGTLAVVLASLAYAVGGLYGQGSTGRASGPVLATSATLYGGLLLLPFGLLQLPDHLPGWKPVASLLGLALIGTVLAQLILFRLLASHGASKTALVTYLIPPIALFYGAVILNEPVTWSALAGLALILTGVALGSGVLRGRRRAAGVVRSAAK